MRGEQLRDILSAEEWTALFVLAIHDLRGESVQDAGKRGPIQTTFVHARRFGFRGLGKYIRLQEDGEDVDNSDNGGVDEGGQSEEDFVDFDPPIHVSLDTKVYHMLYHQLEEGSEWTDSFTDEGSLDSSERVMSNDDWIVRYNDFKFNEAQLDVLTVLRGVDDANRVQNGGLVVGEVLAEASLRNAIQVALAGRTLDRRAPDSRFWSAKDVSIAEFESGGQIFQYSPEISVDLCFAFGSTPLDKIDCRKLFEFIAYNHSYNLSDSQKYNIAPGTVLHAFDQLSTLDNWIEKVGGVQARRQGAIRRFQERSGIVRSIIDPIGGIAELLRSGPAEPAQKPNAKSKRGNFPILVLFNLLYGLFGEKKLRPAKQGFLFRLTH